MAVNSPGSFNNLKSPRSPRQLPQLPNPNQPQQSQFSGERSPSQPMQNFACKSPSTPRVFEFPPEYCPETPNANFDFDDFAKSDSVTDSRSSLLPESTVSGSTSNNTSSCCRSPTFYNQQMSGGKSPVRSSSELTGSGGAKSPIFQFCNPRKHFGKTLSYPPKSPVTPGPVSSMNRNRSANSCGSPQTSMPQKSPRPLERARRNSCFSLGPIKSPMSPTTIVTTSAEGLPTSPRGAESSPKLYAGDVFELNSNFVDERPVRNMETATAANNKATSSKQFYKPNVPPLQLRSPAGTAIPATDIFARREHERSQDRDSPKKMRSDRMGSVSLNKSHGCLNGTGSRDEDKGCSSGGSGAVRSNPRHVARKSTSDLTEIDADEIETEVTVLSSPRRRGSMKGGLAYLASRRGSRDSQISNVSNLSNEDVGPLNFQAHPRGRQRRTSNFLELPVPDHIRPRVHSLPEKAYNPRAGDDLYRLRAFSITHKGVVNRGDSIISRRSRSNTSVNSSRNSNVSGERSPFEGSCCSGQGVAADSTESDMDEIPKYRVVLLGDSGVGKTALVSQFMTSEYMNTYDASLDDEFGEKTVSILLDDEESEMIFIDHPHVEMSVENSLSTYDPHACVVVYSIVSRASFQVAEEMLNYLWRELFTHDRSVIVVGNKSDLARSRTIEATEGKKLATSRECKFIETSSGIQHNVDELLVGVLKQIRLRETRDKKLRRQGSKGKVLSKLHGSKTALSLNLAREILNKMCLNDSKSKSCENLHVL